jgi:hypothetical protein
MGQFHQYEDKAIGAADYGATFKLMRPGTFPARQLEQIGLAEARCIVDERNRHGRDRKDGEILRVFGNEPP